MSGAEGESMDRFGFNRSGHGQFKSLSGDSLNEKRKRDERKSKRRKVI